IAASRLAHYNGGASLSFRYLDHNTGETATETLTQRELVARLKQHIPEKFFKMVRYFGFLANRVCGEKLPQVYKALGMDKPEPVAKVCYAQMVKQFLRRDPFECVLCGGRMVYRRAVAGLNVDGLKKNARDISLLGTVAKLAMRQPFVLFKGLTFQKLCLPGAFRPGDHHNKMLRPG
ncbi:transposase, partial [Escherichia coli]